MLNLVQVGSVAASTSFAAPDEGTTGHRLALLGGHIGLWALGLALLAVGDLQLRRQLKRHRQTSLALREADRGLSAGEKSMLAKARGVLVSELSFALNVSEDEALDRVSEHLT